MKQKYRFYKNRKTRYHPSLQIGSNEIEWENMEMTSSPTKKNRYIKLKENPGPDKSKQSFIRKYVRRDPIKTRGQLLEKYKLSEEDLEEIEKFLESNKLDKQNQAKFLSMLKTAICLFIN